jgi:hypothetical protein
MYACILETGCGYFEGVCAPSNATAHLHDPPPLLLDARNAMNSCWRRIDYGNAPLGFYDVLSQQLTSLKQLAHKIRRSVSQYFQTAVR